MAGAYQPASDPYATGAAAAPDLTGYAVGDTQSAATLPGSSNYSGNPTTPPVAYALNDSWGGYLADVYGSDPFAINYGAEFSIDTPAGGALTELFPPGDQALGKELAAAYMDAMDAHALTPDDPSQITHDLQWLFQNPSVVQNLRARGGTGLQSLLNRLLFTKGSPYYARATQKTESVRDQAIRALTGMDPLQFEEHQLAREIADQHYADMHKRYSGIYSVYSSYFGTAPSDAQVLAIAAHGGNAAEWENYVRSLPSHIPNVSIGRYTDTKGLADTQSKDAYGFPANDTIIKDLVAGGWHSKQDIQFYYEQLPFKPGMGVGQVDPKIFRQIADAGKEWSQRLYNEAPHPTHLQQIYELGGGDAQHKQAPDTPKPSDAQAAA